MEVSRGELGQVCGAGCEPRTLDCWAEGPDPVHPLCKGPTSLRPKTRQLSFLWGLSGPWLHCGVHREFPREEALLRISLFPLAKLPRQEGTLGNAAQDGIFRQQWDRSKAPPWADGRAGPRGTVRGAVVRLVWDPGERARCWEGLGHESRLVRGEH